MGAKVLIVVICGVVAIIGLPRLWSNYQHKDASKRRNISGMVQAAKSSGKKDIYLPPAIPYYASVNGIDDALAHYTTVVAQPIVTHTRVNSQRQDIETWYKLQVSDFLSEPRNASPCSSCSSPEVVPPELLPIKEDEVLVVRNTGSLVSEGVKITSTDLTFPEFKLNQKYLFFLLLDTNTRVGSIELGPAGIVTIGSDGEVGSLNEQNGKLSLQLKERYGKIEGIKERLKFRRFPESR